MKKQFFRVKQLADQTFLKAEKSEIFNQEELQLADQRVECLRSAITSINKKLSPNGPITDKEKRLKKCFEYQLGTTFAEESKEERECLLFQCILREAGRAEQDLGKEFAEHETKVEELVCSPLQRVLENEFPNILKLKHNLKKYCLDKDSASTRYHATKKETLKDDMEEADSKVEQHRDSLAIEMFSLLARENEFSSYILQLLKLQRGYHESALKNLETIIPELEKKIGDSVVKRVFGIPLQEHLRITGKKLAYPLEVCITTLAEFGMTEEGIFRHSGTASKIKRLKSSIDSGCFSALIPEYRDVHVLASTLKLYLRELPEPLLTFRLQNEWIQSMQCPENQRLEAVKAILNKLPVENKDNLAYLVQFLAKLTQHPENKMSSSNIAIVMSPNLLWDQQELNMSNCGTTNMLVELFIKEVNTLFPEDVSSYVTVSGLIQDDEPISRVGNSGNMDASTESLCDSPRPNMRKKKPAAPIPPSNSPKNEHDPLSSMPNIPSYPSGSTTLNRTHKSKVIDQPVKVKTSVGINTDDSNVSFSRRRSMTKEEINNAHNLVNENSNTKFIAQEITVGSTQMVNKTVRPQEQPPPVVDNEEKSFKTVVMHHVGHSGEGAPLQKPVAAPRQLINHTQSDSERNVTIARTPSLRNETSKSLNSNDFGDVQLRRPEVAASKPEIPARPASLVPAKRSSLDVDPTLQKTQCQYYHLANKQQPSIIHMQNPKEKFQLGHDNNIAEKEKFLGHQPTQQQKTSNDNRYNNDINLNRASIKPLIPPKSLPYKSIDVAKSNEKLNVTKSNEKINDSEEKTNGNTAKLGQHLRTRSDGNIIDIGKDKRDNVTSLLHTPPSPRSLCKPTHPPPPPPVAAVQVKKPQPESTDF